MTKKIYITTTLPYLNSVPHIGHALELVQGDVLSRYLKKIHGKENVHFNTGVDEHGLKIYQAAQKEGKDTQVYCDEFAEAWKEFLEIFTIEPDTFWRTTDNHHKYAASRLWELSFSKGDIYEKEYEGHYCVGCESFKTPKDLVDGKCPDHGNSEIKVVKEKNYFFRLSKYRYALTAWLDSNQDFLTPSSKREELRNMILNLEDISVSRLKTSVPWGIEVPNDPEQNMYVWFEALTNYITSCGYGFKMDRHWKPYWENSIQLCGPDNLRFQGVIWQGLLESFGISHTKKLLVHGMVAAADGTKMSKSVGNVIDPVSQVNKYGLAAVRYYILAGLPTYGNCSWDENELVKLYNAHLANNFGNLLNRVSILVLKNQVVLEGEIDEEFVSNVNLKFDQYALLFDKFEIKQAILELSGIGDLLNEYITTNQPWKEKTDQTDKVLKTLHILLVRLSHEYAVILPETKDRIQDVLNGKKDIVFPRILL